MRNIGVLDSYLNTEVRDRLERLAAKLEQVAGSAGVRRETGRANQRLPGGLVPRAIRRVLAEAVGPMRLVAIHEAVELELGQTVPRSTIKNGLAREARRNDQLVRLGHGRYRLIGVPTKSDKSAS